MSRITRSDKRVGKLEKDLGGHQIIKHHCGNCIKSDWCKACGGDGANSDCADWLKREVTPEALRNKTYKGA